MSIIVRSLSQPRRPGPPGARGRDQPRRQGRQGRPALLVHGARRRRRRTRSRRRRLRQGQRGAAGDPEGRRAGQEGPLPRAQARQHDHPSDDRHLRRRARAAEAGLARYRRDRRRWRARGARARGHPRHPLQEPRHAEPDQPRQGDRRRPARPAHARGGRRAARPVGQPGARPRRRGDATELPSPAWTPRPTAQRPPPQSRSSRRRRRERGGVRPDGRAHGHPAQSRNGANKKQLDTLRSLGLRRIGHTVEVKDCEQARGMLHAVRHLVEVDEGKK